MIPINKLYTAEIMINLTTLHTSYIN